MTQLVRHAPGKRVVGKVGIPLAAAVPHGRTRRRLSPPVRVSAKRPLLEALKSAAVATDWPDERLAAALALSRCLFVGASALGQGQSLAACHSGADDNKTSSERPCTQLASKQSSKGEQDEARECCPERADHHLYGGCQQ